MDIKVVLKIEKVVLFLWRIFISDYKTKTHTQFDRSSSRFNAILQCETLRIVSHSIALKIDTPRWSIWISIPALSPHLLAQCAIGALVSTCSSADREFLKPISYQISNLIHKWPNANTPKQIDGFKWSISTVLTNNPVYLFDSK